MGQKVRKNFQLFTISRLYVPISQKLLKIEAYKQVRKKRFISPLFNCRMCMDPLLTGFYRVSQKVSDVIPVVRLMPIATQLSAVTVFLSVAKCSRLCRAQTCAHSGIEPSTLAKGFLHGGPKVRKKFEFLTIFSLYVPYISATAKNRCLQAAYVAFWPSLWKHREICAPWKSYLECEWRVCVSSTDALVSLFGSVLRWDQRLRPNGSTLAYKSGVEINQSPQFVIADVIGDSSLISLY